MKWNNVLCIYPYRYRNPYYAFPPLALEYLAGAIEDIVEKVTLVDLRFEKDIKPYFKDVDIVATFGHFEDCAIFGQLKEDSLLEIAELLPKGIPLITGGTVSLDIEATFKRCKRLNIVIRGNPEYPVRELFLKGSPEGVKNLVYRNNGELIFNESYTYPISNEILPARHLRRYEYQVWGISCDILKTSMGCNYRCSFCYQYGKGFETKYLKWQGRTPDSIFKELQSSNAVFVGFMDDDLLVDMERIDKLCDLVISSKMKKLFAGNSRTNYIIKRGKTLKKMEKAGFIGMSYGIESPYDKTLKLYKKGTTPAINEEALRLMNKTNMLLISSFILGSPGETKEEILYYLQYARKFDIDSVVTNRLRIPEDTELYKQLFNLQTGELKDPKYKMVEGKELEEIKYAIKYGQRTPLRILLILMKLSRHKGMFISPLYILISFLNTAIKGSAAERIFVIRWLLGIFMAISRSKPWRMFERFLAIILYQPVKIINQAFELLDAKLNLSIKILPKVFNILHHKVYEKQKFQHGWKKG
ncbi:MAG: radical SAM protein [bacterium]